MARIQNRQNKPHLYENDDDDDSADSYSSDLMSIFIVQNIMNLYLCKVAYKLRLYKNELIS